MAHSMLRHKDNGSSPSGKAQDFGLKKCGCGGTGRRARLRIQSLRGAGSSPVIRIQLNITKPVIYRSNRGTFTKKVSFFAFFMYFKKKAEKEKKKQYLDISVENIRIEIVSFTDSNYMLI